jgi:penicillin-binding protein 1A
MNYGKRAAKHREHEIDAIGTKLRKKIGVIIRKAILICIILCAVTGISAGIGVWKGIIDSAPDISAIDVVPTGYSTTVLDSKGNQVATLVASGANRKYVTIDETGSTPRVLSVRWWRISRQEVQARARVPSRSS